MADELNKHIAKKLFYWLLVVTGLIFTIIIIGGITRLTGSGLSMVDWHPVYGILPPLNPEQWTDVFNAYKQFPEYQIKNNLMTLTEFKKIFFWEYLHRILGRIIGLSIIMPYIYFLITKQLNKEFTLKGFIISLLVVTQGIIGWYMVKSGLVDKPHVDHLRLTLHLSTALLLLQTCIWSMLSLFRKNKDQDINSSIKRFCFNVTIILILQIIYGAFTAGLKAGYGYNTFPKMSGEWLPISALQMIPFVKNIIYNPAMVQFIHRMVGIVLLLSTVVLGFLIEKNSKRQFLKTISRSILFVVIIQYALGVSVILLYVPLSLASIHQFGATVLLTLFVVLNHALNWNYKPLR